MNYPLDDGETTSLQPNYLELTTMQAQELPMNEVPQAIAALYTGFLGAAHFTVTTEQQMHYHDIAELLGKRLEKHLAKTRRFWYRGMPYNIAPPASKNIRTVSVQEGLVTCYCAAAGNTHFSRMELNLAVSPEFFSAVDPSARRESPPETQPRELVMPVIPPGVDALQHGVSSATTSTLGE